MGLGKGHELLDAALVLQRQLVEVEAPDHALALLAALLPPGAAGPLEGIGDEVDTDLRYVRPPAAIEHPVAITVELVLAAPVSIRQAPLRPELAVLLTVFGLGLVERQGLVDLLADHGAQRRDGAAQPLSLLSRALHVLAQRRWNGLAAEVGAAL